MGRDSFSWREGETLLSCLHGRGLGTDNTGREGEDGSRDQVSQLGADFIGNARKILPAAMYLS